ncbi:MAG: arginine--tRNA ligase [Thermoplasmatota archaeon]
MEYVLIKFKQQIEKKVRKYLNLDENIDIPIEVPSKEKGDYAIPCFSFASILKKSPTDIAEDIANNIELDTGHIEDSGPYVNFNIDEEYLIENTIEASLKHEKFGKLSDKNEKLLVEHTSANPNGPLHVGRARNPIIGDTVARIYEMAGYDLEKQYYVNDIGRQMAILAWGRMNLDEDDLPSPERDKIDYEIVRYYQEASRLLKNDETLEKEIRDIIKRMEKGDQDIFKIFQDSSEKVLDGITQSLSRLNIFLDSFKNESEFVINGSVNDVIKKIEKLKESNHEDGALYFEKRDNKTFLTREDGTNLYPARDIAYHIWKSENSDKLVNILGEDHKLHGEFLKNALSALNISPILDIIFYSFVTFEGKEMSTRKGKYVTLDEFMDTAHEKAKEEILKRRDDLNKEAVEDIAEKVGLGAVRYNIIKVQPGKPIDFRWKEALDFQGNSAPFIQYTHARADSILRKYDGDVDKLLNLSDQNIDLKEPGEIMLIKKIAEFPRTILEAKEQKSPHKIANYAYELAAEFNQFYRDYPVLKSESKKEERILLVKGFKNVISNVLYTLGIDAPEKM